MVFVYFIYGLWLFAIDILFLEVVGVFICVYNIWFYEEFCSYDFSWLKGVVVMNFYDFQKMVKELYWIVNLGWKVVFLCFNLVKGRILSDLEYEFFWIVCEELDIVVGFYEVIYGCLLIMGVNRFNSCFVFYVCFYFMEQMMVMLVLIEGGVLECYLKLWVGFLEFGCGWFFYWLW